MVASGLRRSLDGETSASELGWDGGAVLDLGAIDDEEDDLGRPCWTEGEFGIGPETILGDSCATLLAAISAALAFLFSANSALIVELTFLAGAGPGLVGTGATTPLLSCELAFSSCFLAAPSRLPRIVLPLAGQMPWKLQKAARARSRTEGFTSASPFLSDDSSWSSRPGVVSMQCLDLVPWISRKVLRCPVEKCRVWMFFSETPDAMCEM
jgi:hypothetical protein